MMIGQSRAAAWPALLIIALLVACDPSAVAETAQPAKEIELDDEIKQASYQIGFSQAQSILDQTAGVADMEAFLAGVQDYVAGNDPRVSNQQAQAAFATLRSAVEAKQTEASQAVRDAGAAFRAEYAKREGVQTLPSGLMYQVLVDGGDGPMPGPTDTVTTHYHGTLVDGTVFDSSVDRGQPASFPVNGVISGWTEALQLMSVGSKWRLVLPPDLAYGERGAGGQIGPGATLVFEVELISID